MNWNPVESKAMSRIGYDAASYVLGIETSSIKKGQTEPTVVQYFYINVPPEIHQRFLAADSLGVFWAQSIKPKYECRKGDGSVAQQSPVAKPLDPGIGQVIAQSLASATVVVAPAMEMVPLTVSFSSGEGNVASLETMVAGLTSQIEAFYESSYLLIDDLVHRALLVKVASEEDFIRAAAIGAQLKDWRLAIGKQMTTPKRSIDAVKAVFLSKEKQLIGLAESGENFLADGCTAYRTAERTRKTQEAKAEQDRLFREAENKRLEDAAKAQAKGNTALAEALLDAPIQKAEIKVEAAIPKGTGTKAKIYYKWRVLDLAKLPVDWRAANAKVLNEFATNAKLEDGTIRDGVEFYTEEDTNF